MDKITSVLLTKTIHDIVRTSYMRSYEKLVSGEKNEILIHHRTVNFEKLFCGKCIKELEINNQVFLIDEDRDQFVIYCEKCGIGKFDEFFIDEESLKIEENISPPHSHRGDW